MTWFREIGILAALSILVILVSAANPMFLQIDNLATVLRASAFTGVMAVGVGFLLMSGMIDISVGAIAGLAAIITSSLIVKMGIPILPAFGAGLICGAAAGMINANLVMRLKLPAFLATIATMFVFRGLALYLSNGYTVYPLPRAVELFGTGTPLGISWHFLIFISLIIIGELVLRETIWGLTVRATGSDREIAKCTEVNVDRVNLQTFMLCGTLSAMAGMLLMSRIITGQPTIGTGWELNAITAAAIGGVSLFGYEGSMIGVFLGVLLVQVIQNGLVVAGISAYLQQVVVGSVLLITAIFDIKHKQRLESVR